MPELLRPHTVQDLQKVPMQWGYITKPTLPSPNESRENKVEYLLMFVIVKIIPIVANWHNSQQKKTIKIDQDELPPVEG